MIDGKKIHGSAGVSWRGRVWVTIGYDRWSYKLVRANWRRALKRKGR
jgi:hypothetical protein